MTTGLLLGCGLGAAVCLLLVAVFPPSRSLLGDVRRWEGQRRRPAAKGDHDPGVTESFWLTHQHRAGAWIAGRLAARGISLDRLVADLELVDQSLAQHLGRKMTYAVGGLLLPSSLTAALLVAGMTPPLTVPLAGGLLLAVAFFWLPDAAVTQEATRRRAELRRALSCYLDLVAMSLAGGRGVPEALPTSARIGTGWAFGLLRDTLDHARYRGTTPWAAFADLGRRTRMQELEDLGGALLLVANDGARVRTSLTARASTQRHRQLAEAEGAAARADQSIQLAQVVLAIGFFLFLGYPAVVAVMGL